MRTAETTNWFVPLRLTSYVIAASVIVVWLRMPQQLQLPLLVYSVFTLLLALAMVLQRRQFWRQSESWIVGLQFLSEIWVESTIVGLAGPLAPPFAGLYLLTIVSAAMAYRLTGTLAIATVGSLGYSLTAIRHWLLEQQQSGLPVELPSILQAPDHLFYTIFLHVLLFYLVAFVAGYLAERLSSQDTALAAASNALRRARLETDDILRHLNSGVISVDSFGQIIFFNRAAERILEYDESEIRGKSCQAVFAARMPELAMTLLDGVGERRAHPRREIEIRSQQNRIIPVGLSTSVLSDEEGRTRGVIAIFSDLTDAKALEAKIRTTDRLVAIGELSASIAHEIRNPLAAISGSVEVLQRELPLHGDNARLMDLIVKESHRLSKILSEFLTYARIDRPTYRKVELCHLVGDVIELLAHHQSYRPAIALRLESDQAVAYVNGDEDLITQLLLNLGLNACEAFTDGHGTIRFQIRHHESARTVCLIVEDDGPGMSDEEQGRVFQPFYSTKKNGTGLGLAIVHRICESLSVELSLRSAEGAGTAFELAFPAFGSVERRTLAVAAKPGEFSPSI